ncbi:antA/AntB antirepressor family protein [Halomonas sp. 707B3]|uniref:antA/AntB antirepressor family protein n=1 Tax=Halomonas sp. 707B3 TaxID=1681043 RepID=UPI0020A0D6FF|nr:antA/AntB antirepressor family protein [Halomonas sp. 707B3]MCP1316865.1 antA/AntB antirepressor family protein [Halomonas sp. 707B3]
MKQALAMMDTINRTCDARELHEALDNKTPFRDWIRRRIEEYGFVEGQDFTKLDRANLRDQDSTHGGDRRSVDYTISLDMAKQLAMLERTQLGRDVRQYFIDAEKELKRRIDQERQEMIKRHGDEVAMLHHKNAKMGNTNALLRNAVEGYRNGNRWRAMAFFVEETREYVTQHKAVLTGHLANDESHRATVMAVGGLVYMDGLSLARLLGLTIPQVAKLTTTEQRRSFEGTTLYSLVEMPEPLML